MGPGGVGCGYFKMIKGLGVFIRYLRTLSRWVGMSSGFRQQDERLLSEAAGNKTGESHDRDKCIGAKARL